MAAASTTPLRSNLRWGSNRLVVSLFFFSSMLLLQIPKGNAALDPEEESVLETVRQRFNLPNWIEDPCDSSWVTCSTNSQVAHVLAIRLYNRGFEGTIPADLAKLRHLEDLDLEYNMFTGPIPDLSNLTNLINLNLRGNMLTGKILDTSAFTNLLTIRLGGNSLSGGIPASLFQHPSLSAMELNLNPLGSLIPDMSELTNLNYLYLSNTNITGSIPESINKMVEAIALYFYDNPNLKGTIPNLSEMVYLQYFDVSSCSLSGLLPDLENSTGLRLLYVQNNDFSGPIPRALFEHQNLQWLDLSNNSKLSGEIPDMSQMSNIKIFKGFNCNFEGPLPNMEANTKLTMLDVSNNKMRGNLPELPAGSAQISDEDHRLFDLNFTNNNFFGEIPMSWTELTFLRTMRLGNNGLSGYIPIGLGKLTNLQELNLSSNNFSGPIPNEIGLLKDLTSLDLRNNLFDNIVPEALATLPNLTTLRLENNRFTAIPEALIQKYNKGLIYLTYDKNTMMTSENSTAESDLSTRVKNIAKSNLSTGAIVGIIVSCCAVVVSFLGLVWCVMSRRTKKHADQLSREDMPKSSRAFTLRQIKAITANNKTLIGKGGFGQVYHGKLLDGKEVAVKVRAVDSKQGAPEFLNEVRLLSRLHHRNLVPLVGYCLEAQQQILVYEYMAQGTLHDHLYRTGSNGSDINSPRPPSYEPLDWKTRLDIAINAARGLEYLHKDCSPPVIHRDVKPSNILLTEKLKAKVTDFGISKQIPGPDSDVHNPSGISTGIKGTLGYLDPEYFVRRKLTTKSDVYSFGVVLLEIITGRGPHSDCFPNTVETNFIDWVRDAISHNEVESVVDDVLRGNYKTDCMLKVAKIALSCVSFSGEDRPDMSEIVHTLIEVVHMEGDST